MKQRTLKRKRKRKTKKTKTTEIPYPLFAMDLAESYIRHYRVVEESEREHCVWTILDLAQYLAQSVGPLAWDALVVEDYVAMLAGVEKTEMARVAYTLIGFYQLLVLEGIIRGRSARRVFREMQRIWPDDETNGRLLESAIDAVQALIGIEDAEGPWSGHRLGEGEGDSVSFIDMLELELPSGESPPN